MQNINLTPQGTYSMLILPALGPVKWLNLLWPDPLLQI